MPIYDYECACGERREDVFVQSWDVTVTCECGNKMVKSFSRVGFPSVHQFPKGGLHLKHVCPKGKTFHSKSEMKRYAKKHKLELGALL